MKVLLTYSSRTGNTERVAGAIREVLPGDTAFYKMSDAPPPEEFDIVIAGFWIDRGLPNKEALSYLETIKNKKVAFFFTLGARPDSAHAQKCIEKVREYFKDNLLIGEFFCQGKIDEKLIESFKSLPAGHPHTITEESLKRYAMASSHPDDMTVFLIGGAVFAAPDEVPYPDGGSITIPIPADEAVDGARFNVKLDFLILPGTGGYTPAIMALDFL